MDERVFFAAAPGYDRDTVDAAVERLLRQRGVKAQLTCYGSPQDSSIGHVFHLDLRKPEAKQCNDDSAEFFRKYL